MFVRYMNLVLVLSILNYCALGSGLKEITSTISLESNGNTEEVSTENYVESPSSNLNYFRNISKEDCPYPNKFNVSMSIGEFIEKYKDINSEKLLKDYVSLAGRIMVVNKDNGNIKYEITGGGLTIQVIDNSDKNATTNTDKLRRGDIIGIMGYPEVNDYGLRLVANEIKLLAPSLHLLPDKMEEGQCSNRYLELILNDKIRQIFVTRAKIITYIRKFLDDLNFLEVETPLLNAIPGGAAAKPFLTHHDDLNEDFYLRISPELYHKMLIVGGLDKVYEIGRQFRNEKINPTHNPEFTSLEFYMAYADYNDLITLTEELLSGLVKSITGSYKIKYHTGDPDGKVYDLDFTPPYERIYMIPALEKELNVTFPPSDQLDTAETNKLLIGIFEKHKIKCPPPNTTAKILDCLVSNVLQVKCVNPTFILDYPQLLSPLAKYHRDQPGLTERFELYAATKEISNAYTELNDPFVQRETFNQQSMDRVAGDDEAMIADEAFITALEYGLPPCAGLGIGIDRLVMLLTDRSNIKDVLLFPTAKAEEKCPIQTGHT